MDEYRVGLDMWGLPMAAAYFVTPFLPGLLRRAGLGRTNFEGREISTGGGILFAAAMVPWLWIRPPLTFILFAVAVLGFGLLGLIDDRWGTPEHRGLKGHLAALRQGRVTTGLLKAGGGILLAAGLTLPLDLSLTGIFAAALVALAANTFNLLDLRPLRCLKAFWFFGGLLTAAGAYPLLPLLGVSVSYCVLEARRAVMLGDTGSNALGASVGLAAAYILPAWGVAAAAVALALFHAWAESHSLTAWIERHRWARAVDAWGWMPRKGPDANG